MQQQMCELVKQLAAINSFSQNREGLQQMFEAVRSAFLTLNPDTIEQIDFENGPGLYLTKRPDAPNQIYLGGHLDTVFPKTSTFQVEECENGILKGPGVTDMKSGLVIMLYALKDELPKSWGWRVFLNPDEEIGSIYSTPFIEKVARGVDFALIFEPMLPDGSYVKARRGSINYVAAAIGRAAHVGRNPHEGICANTALAGFIYAASKLDSTLATVKVGTMKGGVAANVVSDYAECQVNIRSYKLDKVEKKLFRLAKKFGVTIERKTTRPPKPYDLATKDLFNTLAKLTEVKLQETAGVCDGNTVAALGVPTIDTMGALGGKIHTEEEFLQIDSLVKKARLTRQFLIERTHASHCGQTSCGCRP